LANSSTADESSWHRGSDVNLSDVERTLHFACKQPT
jgi:hypothetical protein